jgi:hypothetical protein
LNPITLSIVVCGWHFKNEDMFGTLTMEVENHGDIDAEFYIVSHRTPEEIDENVLEGINQLGWNILYFSNVGWDWGAYQQFLIWQKDRDAFSDFYLFLHDDIVIKQHGFLSVFLEKIREGYVVVGNSISVSKKEDIRRLYPEDILWTAQAGFPIESPGWEVVRGSCFLTTKDVATRVLLEMPVKVGNNLAFANCSLRVFGGLVTDTFGASSITHIGNTPRTSDYIYEELRGENVQPTSMERLKTLLRPFINRSKIKRFLRISKVSPVEQGTGLKLHLGCGEKCLYGYFNVDMASSCAELNSDINCLEFPAGSVSEVLMVHVIEHVEYFEVPRLLRKIYYWLRSEGQLILEFPDVLKVARLVLKRKNDPDQLQSSPYGIRGFYGGPVKNMSIHDYHKWGWTDKTLAPILRDAGFKRTFTERAQWHSRRRDTRVVALK